MPCMIGRDGILKQLPVTLNEWETAKLSESAAFIQVTMKDADTGPKV